MWLVFWLRDKRGLALILKLFFLQSQEQHSQWVWKWAGHEAMVLYYIAWLLLGISFFSLCNTGIGATNSVPHPQHFHNLFPRELFGVSILDFLCNGPTWAVLFILSYMINVHFLSVGCFSSLAILYSGAKIKDYTL